MPLTTDLVLEVITSARNRISSPSHWTHGVYAKNSKGWDVPILADDACRWCASGSLKKSVREVARNRGASAGVLEREVRKAINNTLREIFGPHPPEITVVNDGTGPQRGRLAVIKVFDKAIELLKSERTDA